MAGKTKEEVAFELVAKLKGVGVWGEHNRAEILDMYAECLEATSGLRQLPGRKPVAQPQAQAQVQPQAQPAPATAQPQAAPQQPVVQQQQQRVQQAYQQQAQAQG